MTATVALPQSRIPLGWATVQGVRVPVEIGMEWMLVLSRLLERTGGTSGDTNFGEYINQFFDAPLTSPESQENARAIEEMRGRSESLRDDLRQAAWLIDEARQESSPDLRSIMCAIEDLQGSASPDGALNLRPIQRAIEDLQGAILDAAPPAVTPFRAAYIAPVLLNSWVNSGGGFSTAGYYRDPLGIVRLRGFVSGGVTTYGTPIFTLPAGYQPALSLAASTVSNSSPGEVRVDTAGNVLFCIGSNASFSLDNITFLAA